MTSTSSKPRGPYAKTASVRRNILQAALQAFAESGYRATTLKSVAARAGISQRGLVHHFASKEDLLAGVLADYDAHVADAMPSGSGLHAVEGIIDVTSRDLDQPVIIELYAILSAEAASPTHPAHAHYRQRYRRFRIYLVEQFDVLRADGQLRSSLDSESLARMFIAVLDGLHTQWLYDREDTDVATSLRGFLAELLVPEASRLAFPNRTPPRDDLLPTDPPG